MPIETLHALGESNITISDGGQLSGISQGNGSHLVGHTITLNNTSWESVEISDNDGSFKDSDGSQRLEGDQEFDGQTYSDNTRVEAEYRLVLEDDEGNTYEALGFNFNEAGVKSYATVEGLAFKGEVPPAGVELTVVSAHEGPNVSYDELATPPCFTKGCRIDTPDGPRAIEELRVGDLVETLDHGPQPIRWIGVRSVSEDALNENSKLRPVRIVSGALGQGLPKRDLLVSRQHRVMLSSPIVSKMADSDAVLTAAHSLCSMPGIYEDPDATSVEYYHLLFDQHEIVFSEGAPTESLFVGPEIRRSIPKEALEEIYTLFPELEQNDGSMDAALPILDGKASKLLVERHAKNERPILSGLNSH